MQTSSAEVPLSIHQLSHHFGAKPALNEVTLQLDKQRITALLGSNGAGKTTLINCALGLLRPSKGRVEILGQQAGTHAAKCLTGVMLQDADLPDLLTAREHISLFSAYYPDPIPIGPLVDQCNLTKFADTKYKHLSAGQKRRVQFALAILGRPKLVFLDEPTTGLDSDARNTLWNTICELKNSGTSIILTTHYLEEADTLADRIVVIDNGEIIAKGTNNEIRNAVNGSMIRCNTNLGQQAVQQLASVRATKVVGRYLEILSSNGTNTLRALLRNDPRVSDITVGKPSLEDAFQEITRHQEDLS